MSDECPVLRSQLLSVRLRSTQVDVWSAGVVFFQLLYGKRPFGHDLTQACYRHASIALLHQRVSHACCAARCARPVPRTGEHLA